MYYYICPIQTEHPSEAFDLGGGRDRAPQVCVYVYTKLYYYYDIYNIDNTCIYNIAHIHSHTLYTLYLHIYSHTRIFTLYIYTIVIPASSTCSKPSRSSRAGAQLTMQRSLYQSRLTWTRPRSRLPQVGGVVQGIG